MNIKPNSLDKNLNKLQKYAIENREDKFIKTYKKIQRRSLSDYQLSKLETIARDVYLNKDFKLKVGSLINSVHKLLQEPHQIVSNERDRNLNYSSSDIEKINIISEKLAKGLQEPLTVQSALEDIFKEKANLEIIIYLIENQEILKTVTDSFLKANNKDEAVLDLYLLVYYASESKVFRSFKKSKSLLLFLSEVFKRFNVKNKVGIDIYKKSLAVRFVPDIFFQLLESYFEMGMYQQVVDLIEKMKSNIFNSVSFNILELRAKSHLALNDFYPAIVKEVYLRLLAESKDENLKFETARSLCCKLNLLNNDLQKEVVEAIEKYCFPADTSPTKTQVESIISFDTWEIFRENLTNPFLKLIVEDLAAGYDLDRYRNYVFNRKA